MDGWEGFWAVVVWIILLFLAMNLIVSFDVSVRTNQTERNRSLYVAYRRNKKNSDPNPDNFNEGSLKHDELRML